MRVTTVLIWFGLICVLCLCPLSHNAWAIGQARYVEAVSGQGSFPIVQGDEVATLCVDIKDWPGVIRAVNDLQADIARITDRQARITQEAVGLKGSVILIGTLGRSPIIDGLAKAGKIDTRPIAGQWESFLIQVVPDLLPGVAKGLVIAGSDKRGTIYGIYDLSEQMGVSPWYWWADVPAMHKDALYVKSGTYVQGPPSVKYRGLFLNDEEPCLGRWAVEKYGGFNHRFYERLFELILRLKGNYLWPAMWWASFNSDDPNNPRLAEEYGIVMSTSHHEPMMRAHAEWRTFGGGAWNYETNAEKLYQFWTEGIRRMDSYESIVTLAMRGDGDSAMSPDTNIALLERIVADQRRILADVTGRDVTTIPQVWAIYKEVQEYYDKGMRVPEDVTLLLCDDNWGNVRRLPRPDAPARPGGYGMYYHFDFHGGPVSYEWLNTSPLPRIWEQMHLCLRLGVDRIWLVNVGDLKPMELPITFFLDYAWNPDRWPASRLPEYTRLWAGQQFGPEHAEAIAEILTGYTKFNGRRKPEMLGPKVYSLAHYREAQTVVEDWNRLAQKAERLNPLMPAPCKDAYFQLVLYPVAACANLNEMYYALARNLLYATQGRAATQDMAEKVRASFARDAELFNHYNKVMAGGKWNHMMDARHIGFTSWSPPRENRMPAVKELEIPAAADMGVAIEGSDQWWPMEKAEAVLPAMDGYNRQTYSIEVFNRGRASFEYTARAGESWVAVTPPQGIVDKEQRLWVSVDWAQAPTGTQRVPITIAGPNDVSVVIQAVVNNPAAPKPDQVKGFIEANGCVSMEAEHYTKAVEKALVQWLVVPDLSRTLSGIMPVPVTAKAQTPTGDSPRLEYDVYLFSSGNVKVETHFCPTQDYIGEHGIRYAVSFDDETPKVVNIHEKDTVPDWKYPPTWNQAVTENIKKTVSEHRIDKPGPHVLKFWMVDPGIVLQKIVVDTGGVKPSYLGPPESYRH